MKKFLDKPDIARTVEIATLMQKLKPDEQRDVLNIVRGFSAAKGVDILSSDDPGGCNRKATPQREEPPKNDKSA